MKRDGLGGHNIDLKGVSVIIAGGGLISSLLDRSGTPRKQEKRSKKIICRSYISCKRISFYLDIKV